MRRLAGAFEPAVSLPNLWAAWRTFRRGKRERPSVRAFEVLAAEKLVELHHALTGDGYRPGGFRLLLLHEPKRRLIAAAPVIDRVVHHAVHRVLAPALDRTLIDRTYACLPGRGSHRAALAFLGALRRYRYLLQLDIRRYFLSIDRRILAGVLARKIRDRRMLALLSTIAESGEGLYQKPGVAEFLGLDPGFPPPGCGLPIGNLTSQWWGNLYLSGLDHFVLRRLRVPHYQRYMDDLTLFSDSAAELRRARTAVRDWLEMERHLRLKEPRAAVRPTRGRFRYLGFRIGRGGIEPTPEALARMRRRIAEVVVEGDRERVERSVASYLGMLRLPGGAG